MALNNIIILFKQLTTSKNYLKCFCMCFIALESIKSDGTEFRLEK